MTTNTQPRELTDQNFTEYLNASKVPVLVDFWAPWCGPCRVLSPILEELKNEYSGRVDIVKVNVDENPGLAVKYGVRGIPVVKAFVGGNQVHETVGAYPKHHWVRVIENELQV